MDNRDQHQVNGLTFTLIPRYGCYFFFSFLSIAILVTKGLYFSSILFVGPSMVIQRVFTFLSILLPLASKQVASFWNSSVCFGKELEYEYNIAKRSSTCLTTSKWKRTTLQICVVYHAMQTHCEECMFVFDLNGQTWLCSLKNGNLISPYVINPSLICCFDRLP